VQACVGNDPSLARGGILADAMGLGKTVEMIGVIAASKAAAAAAGSSTRSTLVICPVSVLSVWEEQIAAHVVPGGLTLHVYHGPSRTRDPSVLAGHDVVLTSYSTRERGREGGGTGTAQMPVFVMLNPPPLSP
jgi:SWI/SNF-related matrix-associated actin-dependent regulator of chromatin subfamily A3